MRLGPGMLLAVLVGCAAPRAPEVAPGPEVAPAPVAAPAPEPPAPSTSSAPAPNAPAPSVSAVASAAPAPQPEVFSPCNEITLGPCKVDYSARRTCLVAEGYFSIDGTAETPKQKQQFYACIQKVLALPAGPKECVDAGTRCADAVTASWFHAANVSLPELCAVSPKCAPVVGPSCTSAKKLIDDCYYAARKLKKP